MEPLGWKLNLWSLPNASKRPWSLVAHFELPEARDDEGAPNQLEGLWPWLGDPSLHGFVVGGEQVLVARIS